MKIEPVSLHTPAVPSASEAIPPSAAVDRRTLPAAIAERLRTGLARLENLNS